MRQGGIHLGSRAGGMGPAPSHLAAKMPQSETCIGRPITYTLWLHER